MKKRDDDSPTSHRESMGADRQSHERIAYAASDLPPASRADLFDRLFVVTMSAPIEAGERAIVDYFAGEIAALIPWCAVGICLVPQKTERGAPQYVAARRPPERILLAIPSDPTRVFPDFPHERVVLVEESGTTLHVASDEAFPATSDLGRVLERGGMAIGRSLALSRTHAQARISADELTQLSRHMIQSEKLASLGQLAAGVVHELHNPLTSIIAYTEYLMRGAHARADGADDAERLARIAESATRLQRFTRDLVTYARPSREAPVRVSLNSVADQALAFCEHVLDNAEMAVDRQYDIALPTISGRPEQLIQVFVNLITNAAHALSGRGGKGLLIIRTKVEKGMVRVEVEDDGTGIPAEHLGSVFAPFFTTKRDGEGSGLGLSIVKNIVDAHEGRVWAESAQGSRGARIVLTFHPLA